MSARDVIASELARISRVDMSEAPRYARASVRTAALHVERALTAAGYRIVGPDELDDVTLEKAAEIAADNAPVFCDMEFAPLQQQAMETAAAIRSLGEGR